MEHWVVEVYSKEKFSRHALDYALNELHLLNLSNINANLTSKVVLKLVIVVTDETADESKTLYPSDPHDLWTLPLSISLLISEAKNYVEHCLAQQVVAEVHVESNRDRAEGLCRVVKLFRAVKLFLGATKKVFQLRRNKTVEHCVYHLPPSCLLFKVYSSGKAESIAGKGVSIPELTAVDLSQSAHSPSSSENELDSPSNMAPNVNLNDTPHFTNPGPTNLDSPSVPHPSFQTFGSISANSSIHSPPSHSTSVPPAGDCAPAKEPMSTTSKPPFSLYIPSSNPTDPPNDALSPKTDPLTSTAVDMDPACLDAKFLFSELKRAQQEAREAEELAKKAMDEVVALQNEANIVRKEAALSMAMVRSQRQAEEENAVKKWRVGFRNFDFAILAEACNYFEKENFLGEGRTGNVYRGNLEHINVAVKIFFNDPVAMQEFTNEVEMQSSIRHPNVILILGHCEEPPSIVYEFLDKGTLLDRLRCAKSSPPLPWNVRLNILINVCQALIHLHKRDPPIFSVDLNPSNILLDQNFNAKLKSISSFRCPSPDPVNYGSSHIPKVKSDSFDYLSNSKSAYSSQGIEASTSGSEAFHSLYSNTLPPHLSSNSRDGIRPIPNQTSLQSLSKGTASPCSSVRNTSPAPDLRSLGLLIVDLLVGVDKTNFSSTELFIALDRYLAAMDWEGTNPLTKFWDNSSGNWPSHIAIELVRLAKESCNSITEHQPSLVNEIMPALMRLKEDANAVMEEEQRKHENTKKLTNGIPSNFLCPITWELMEQPVIACDGHTYERIAIEEWLKGHNMSPKTGLILPNKRTMPNHTLHSMIEEWKELHPSLLK